MKANSETRKVQRAYYKDTSRRCRARGSHDDATVLVSYFIERNGRTSETKEQVLEAIGWYRRLPTGLRMLDWGRFERAINHVKDGRAADDRPCTGFSLHYRSSAKGNQWLLIDPSGSFQHHLDVILEELRGDIQQQAAFRTVNGRRIANAEDAAEMCLKAEPMDGEGHRILLSYSMEMKRFGAPSDETIASMNVWLDGRRVSAVH